jgi:hypothetical protein
MDQRSLRKWMEETTELEFMKKWEILTTTPEEMHNQDLELSSEGVSIKVCSVDSGFC